MVLKHKMLNFREMKNFIISRESDLNDGIQHDITEIAKEAGLPFVVFTTAGVWNEWIAPDEHSIKKGETDQKRIRLILQKLIHSIRIYRRNNRSNLLSFFVDLTKSGKTQNVELLSYLGPVSLEKKTPCITLLLRDELNEEENLLNPVKDKPDADHLN